MTMSTRKKYIAPLVLLGITIGLATCGAMLVGSTALLDSKVEPSAAGLTGIPYTINVKGNWSTWAAGHPWCSGTSTAEDPYLIEGLYLDCQGTRSGIVIEKSIDHFVIRNVTIINAAATGSAIHVEESANGLISDSIIVDNKGTGISLYYGCNSTTIRDNIVANNGLNGIYINVGYQNVVSGNHVCENAGRGIWLMKSGPSIVSGNKVDGNWAGIEATMSSQFTIRGNTVSASRHGVRLNDAHGGDISSNNLLFNVHGVTLNASTGNAISLNDFLFNLAWAQESGSDGNAFSLNRVEGPLHGYTGASLFIAAGGVAAIIMVVLFMRVRKRKDGPVSGGKTSRRRTPKEK